MISESHDFRRLEISKDANFLVHHVPIHHVAENHRFFSNIPHLLLKITLIFSRN